MYQAEHLAEYTIIIIPHRINIGNYAESVLTE